MKQKMNVAIQACNFETETAYPNQSKDHICEGIHNDCLSCGEDIQHPLCPNCIVEAFVQWIRKFPEQREIRNRLGVFMLRHNRISGKSKTCVSCGISRANICPYCFTKYLYKLVKEAGLGVQAMSEFLFIFNFDFTHKGYSQELEVYGGY
ncbi:MAG: hypothetical protein ABIF18_04065 [archaeon]